MSLDSKHTAIYLNDHLAGATAGLALARRTLSNNRGTPFERFLETLATEIEEDREVLKAIMRRLDIGEDLVKRTGGRLAELVSRLKFNGSFLRYSPLSRMIELEGLALGVTGKLALWRVLADISDVRLADFGLDTLAARAEAQQEGLEAERRKAARLALV